MPGGEVTSALGRTIAVGHRVQVNGPFGSAYFRPNSPGRLILIATNTGFAPIWSIASAALRENPWRHVVMVVGGRGLDALYMVPALVQLLSFPNIQIVPFCSGQRDLPIAVSFGRPTDFLPQLVDSDVVFACGAPQMVDAIKEVAGRAGAACYADPFMPNAAVSKVAATPIKAQARTSIAQPREMARTGQRITWLNGLAAQDRRHAGMRP